MLHFSHIHSLELCNTPQNHVDGLTFTNPLCEGCKLTIFDNTYYSCKLCNFNFHYNCAQFPQLMTHPSHPFHTLKLRPTAAYSGGVFNCDACNRPGNGFSYHCTSCEFDLHMVCAAKPLKIIHAEHSCLLDLSFLKNPYGGARGFSCNVCGKVGFKEWMYRCGRCEFDVHLDCTETGNVFTGVQEMSPLYGDLLSIQSPISILHNHSFSGSSGHNQESNMQNQATNQQSILQSNVTPTSSVLNIHQSNNAPNNTMNVHLDCTETGNVFCGVQSMSPLYGDPHMIPSPVSVLHNCLSSGSSGYNQASNHLSILQSNVTPASSILNIQQPNNAPDNTMNVAISNVTPASSVLNIQQPNNAPNNMMNVAISNVTPASVLNIQQSNNAPNDTMNVVNGVPQPVDVNPVYDFKENHGACGSSWEVDRFLNLDNMFWDFSNTDN